MTEEREEAQDRQKNAAFLLFLKGMAMGAADSVPGVSGGTIAFITGIYEELINSIKAVNLSALMLLFKKGPLAAWKYVNGNFLLVLLLGIVSSLYFFASTVEFLLEHHPRFLMSFFVGLIIASCWYMFGELGAWRSETILLITTGFLLSVGLAFLPISTDDPSLLYIFFCGALAICAMILPGISGAFILILLGVYAPVLRAVSELDFVTILVFVAGCASGLIAFSNFLSYLFAHFRDRTLSFLLGVLAGSLYTIWPWRVEVSETAEAIGTTEGLMTLLIYLLLALSGFFLVYGLERFASRN